MHIQRDHIRLGRHNNAENQQAEQQVLPTEFEPGKAVGDKQAGDYLQRHARQQNAQRVGQGGTVIHQAERHFKVVHLET